MLSNQYYPELDLSSDEENILEDTSNQIANTNYQETEINNNISISIQRNVQEHPNNYSNTKDMELEISSSEEEELIAINVGGKKFNLAEKIINQLNIKKEEVVRVTGKKNILFLDRDPHYFSQMIDIINKEGCIKDNIKECSDNLLRELFYYELIDTLNIEGVDKITLRKNIIAERENIVVKVFVKDYIFVTTSKTLLKSNHFRNKLNNNNFIINLDLDIDPKIFRYVINFLRKDESYNLEIEKYLSVLGILYNATNNKSFKNTITIHSEIYDSSESIINQLKNNDAINSVDSIKYINAENSLAFDSNIIFDLCDPNIDIITSMFLSIDIPNSHEYVDLFEYKIVENVHLLLSDGKSTKIFVASSNNYEYMHPIIYENESKCASYQNMVKTSNKKTQILYQDTLIDVHRIFYPLFFDAISMKEIRQHNKICKLSVKISPLERITKEKKNIPLLNINLVCNLKHTKQHVEKNIYTKLHTNIYPMIPQTNQHYNTFIIPLEKNNRIKDFFFVIMDREDIINNRIDRFQDDLIEIEFIHVVNNQVITHSVLNNIMMNMYIPIQYLDHVLPLGVYYYSFGFSSSTRSNNLDGIRSDFGFCGKDYILRIKTKKTDNLIKFYINEYIDVRNI
jgi:hypothetical protein